MTSLVYFSSASENTHRFVQKLGLPAPRIPTARPRGHLRAHEPYVLIVPTYGGGNDGMGRDTSYVPKRSSKFLNNDAQQGADPRRDRGRQHQLRRILSVLQETSSLSKCRVPYLYRFELMGTAEDVERVRAGLGQFWDHLDDEEHDSGADQSQTPSTQGA